MLRYTRHPFVDAGVAAVVAFADKLHPEELNEQDLAEVSEYVSKHYPRKPASSFVQLAFTINAVYTQPSVRDPDQREANSRMFLNILLDRDSNSGPDRCGFCGREALSPEVKAVQQVSGPITRQHVPLVLAKGLINFFPQFGNLGIPVCGYCLFAIQALPLGAANCGGRLLIVHSDNEETMRGFARGFLMKHRKNFQLADLSKYPNERFPRTILVDELANIEGKQREQARRASEPTGSVSAYHFTNYGTNADMSMYHLPHQVVDFLHVARAGKYAQIWEGIVRLGWQKVEDAKAGTARNFLYEDLFELPGNARWFVRVYFLRQGYSAPKAFKDDPRREYILEKELELVSWDLTAMFLRRVMSMEKARIDAIRNLGDKLSSYVLNTNDRKFFGDFYRSQGGYRELRGILIKASNTEIRKNRAPLVSFDEFITVFEDSEDFPKIDWRLARDLVLIRMIERLHEEGWMLKNQEVVPDEQPEEQAIES
jgi:CRISPR-associated protein Cst1